MAGIDKICEYSGEYPGGKMYAYKHNLIQVMPKYRKKFKHAEEAFVFVFNPESKDYCGAWHWYVKVPLMRRKWINIPKVFKKGFFSKYKFVVNSPTLTWDYCVFVPSVPGEVQGLYWNYTTDIFKTLKNIDKLIGDMRPHKEVYKLQQTMSEYFFGSSCKEQNTTDDMVRMFLHDEDAERMLAEGRGEKYEQKPKED